MGIELNSMKRGKNCLPTEQWQLGKWLLMPFEKNLGNALKAQSPHEKYFLLFFRASYLSSTWEQA